MSVTDIDIDPERALAAAVIERAIRDLGRLSRFRARRDRALRARDEATGTREREAAQKRFSTVCHVLRDLGSETELIEWLSSPNDDHPCSLGWWCQYLDADATAMVTVLRQRGLLKETAA